MVVRIKLTFEQEEYSGLLKLALSEMRNPESQLRYMVRQELERLGLLVEKDHQEIKVKTLRENSSRSEKDQ